MWMNTDKAKKQKDTKDYIIATEGYETKDRSELGEKKQLVHQQTRKRHKTIPDAVTALYIL